jgi:outer membrane protein OmpA-like peptidoglycan-associated protein
LADYDVKAGNAVKFATGRSTISPEYEEALKTLTKTATSMKGYIVEVTGYADSTASARLTRN